MLTFAFYLFKVFICSGVLVGYYWLALRNKVFHQYNRFYLLASVLLSLLVPLIEINVMHKPDKAVPAAIQLLQVVNNGDEYMDDIVISANQNSFTASQFLWLIYAIVSMVLLFLFIGMLWKIRSLFVKHLHSMAGEIYFVNTTAKGTPFSFLKCIFWNDYIDPETVTGKQIFKHELAHVQQKHSYDKLFINFTLIIFWCIPFFWLIRKELNMIHEFVADKIAVEDSGTEAFAAMILQAAYPRHQFSLTNNFFYSPVKRRLIMLTKSNNSRKNYFSRLMVLPLAAIVFVAFTVKAKVLKQYMPANEKLTVIIDAGHGGKDFGVKTNNGIFEKDLALDIIKKIKELNSSDNINLILTRETDVYQSPAEKASFSKTQHADLFISIHLAAADYKIKKDNTGLEVYVSKDEYENSLKSKLFASAIIDEFSRNYKLAVAPLPQQKNLGIWVIQANSFPSVLIEAGYMTNPQDLQYLQTDEARETIARNILNVIEKYAAFNSTTPGNKLTDSFPYKMTSAQNLSNKNDDATIKKYGDTAKLGGYEINTAGTKLLYVLDGKVMDASFDVKSLAAESIAIIGVLKGKKATLLYGEKGQNGVIEITRKSYPKQKSGIRPNIDPKPLYVVDGKITAPSFDFNAVNPENIETINVLKGQKPTALYRNKGKNGAVQITMKTSLTSKIDVKEKTKPKPIYVVNGKIMEPSFELESIEPANIESINVLKGESAITFYGKSAENGVIEITIKQSSN